MPEESLKNKTVKGTLWSGIDNAVQFGVKALVSIVLARLLSPDDYGLIGIVLIFTAVCETIVDGGLSSALIRKKGVTEDDYNTVFIVNLLAAMAFYGLLLVSSPWIAFFFGREELAWLVRITSLSLIIGAFSLVQRVRLVRRIDFKTQTRVTLGASLTSGVVGITMALLDYGVWALVAQTIILQIVRTLLLAFYNKWLPRLRFSRSSFKELFGFGWKMLISVLLDTVWNQLSQVVVGKFYNPATLGQYAQSNQFAQLFSSNMTKVVQRVTYPVLSSIQDDRIRLASAYRRIIRVNIFVSAVGMFFLGAVAVPLVYCLIGPQWQEAAVYLPLICISGSSYPLQALNLNMLQVLGRSDLFLGLEVIKKMIGIAPLAVGAFVGILPMLYLNILLTILSFFLNSHYSGRLIGYSSWMQIKDIAPSYGVAVITAFSVYFFKYLPLSYWIILPLQIVVGILVFTSICRKTEMKEFHEMCSLILPIFNRFATYLTKDERKD